MPLSPQRDILTKMLLVACDQSYQPGSGSNTPPIGGVIARIDDPLEPYRDSDPSVDNNVINQMPEQWKSLQLTDGTRFTDWRIARRFDNRQTGFGATIFDRDAGGGKRDYIVALQGTRGPNVQDWSGNLIYGWDKWAVDTPGDSNGPDLTAYLTGLGDVINRVHFTGQSLGGALAQYAAYDFFAAKKVVNDQNAGEPGFTPFLKSQMTLTTFNGLGGVEALSSNGGKSGRPTFDSGLLSGVDTAHFYTDNDLVSRLGSGNLNAEGREYVLRVVRTNADGSPILRRNGVAAKVLPQDVHRIETGFYYAFNRAAQNHANRMPLDFTGAAPQAISHLNIAGLARVGTTLAWASNKDGINLTTSESYARLTAAILASAAFGPREQFVELSKGILSHVSAALTTDTGEIAMRGFGELFFKFASSYALTPSGFSAQAGALLNAFMIESMNSLATRSGGSTTPVNIEPDLTSLIIQMTGGVPPGTGNFDLKAAETRGKQIVLGSTIDDAQTAMFVYLTAQSAMVTLLPSLGVAGAATYAETVLEFAVTFKRDPKGMIGALAELATTIIRETGAVEWTTDKAVKLVTALHQLGAMAAENARSVSHFLGATAAQAEAFHDGVVQGTSVVIERVVNSISNGYNDLIIKRNDSFEWGVNVTRQALDTTIKAFASAAKEVAPEI